MTRLALLISTWFGCGYSPVAPGTVGSLAAVLMAWGLETWLRLPPLMYGVLALLLYAPGTWAATRTAAHVNKKDPSLVVVDEVVGQWLTLAGAAHLNFRAGLLAFCIFRILDIWKPAPARQLERLPAGTGIMADDVMAGVYGALLMRAAGWWNLYCTGCKNLWRSGKSPTGSRTFRK